MEPQFSFSDMEDTSPEMPAAGETEVIKIPPETIKALDALDPMQVFQYLKDKKMIPAEMKPLELGEEEGMEDEGMDEEAPAAAPAPISFGEMQT